MGHLDTHVHTYETVRDLLTPEQIAKIIYKIQTSSRFRVDELSHIILKDTDICVGYIGEYTAELVDVERRDIHSQRKHLKRIFHSAKPVAELISSSQYR